MNDRASIRQQRLAILLRGTAGTIRVADAMRLLGIDRAHAAKLLAGWHKQGVIRRISHGFYVPVQPSALGRTQVLEDPWILVPALYEPGYIGGWSALEYWELTEQLFRSVCVFTNKRTGYGDTRHQGVNFHIKYVPKRRLFGTKTIWRDNTKLQISDPQKTILDIIDDPGLGGGLQHTIDCLTEFRKTFDEQADHDLLLRYAIKINNGALFKKLGFLAEKLGFEKTFIDECAGRLTMGYTHLDKGAENNRLATRWRLWVPKGIGL